MFQTGFGYVYKPPKQSQSKKPFSFGIKMVFEIITGRDPDRKKDQCQQRKEDGIGNEKNKQEIIPLLKPAPVKNKPPEINKIDKDVQAPE